jgi:tRNA threonylcarbamoyladenosine dehydratase
MHAFESTRLLYGDESAARLARARVLVVGLGGVGSWVAEALARSGIGALTLMDPDDVCVSNINRQLMATHETIGRFKVDVLAERLRAIHPACRINTIRAFLHRTNAEETLAPGYDYVVDAIDGVMIKARLIAMCKERGIPIITCGGAAGKKNPALVRIVDLSETQHDALLAFVRRKLRVVFGFPPKNQLFHVPCVYSPEPVCDSLVEADHPGAARACDGRLGAAAHITGLFGLWAAGQVINDLAQQAD